MRAYLKFLLSPGTVEAEFAGNIILDKSNQTLRVVPRYVFDDEKDNSDTLFSGRFKSTGGLILTGKLVFDFEVGIPSLPFLPNITITINHAVPIPGFPQIDKGWDEEKFFNSFLFTKDESVKLDAGVPDILSVDITVVEIAGAVSNALLSGGTAKVIVDKMVDIVSKYLDAGINLNGGLINRLKLSGDGIYLNDSLVMKEGQTVPAYGLNPNLDSYSIFSSYVEDFTFALDLLLSSDISLTFAPFGFEMWSYDKTISKTEIPIIREKKLDTLVFKTLPDTITFSLKSYDAVPANRAPKTVGSILSQTLKSSYKDIYIGNKFSDPDGDTLSYSVRSYDTNVVTVSRTGSFIRITPRNAGSTTVTVTASDGSLTATQTISVTVKAAPIAVGTISAQFLTVGGSAVPIDVSDNFSDPDKDPLTYFAISKNTTIATASVSGAQVTIVPKSVGTATITVIASDGSSTAIQRIAVTVSPVPVVNNAPEAVGSIPAQTLSVGGSSVVVNVSDNFSDPDKDPLTYDVSSNDTDVATVSVSDAEVTITPRAAGSTTITVTASDGRLTATQTISVTVSTESVGNNAPIADGSIPAQTLSVGGLSVAVNVAGKFIDPDNDPLTYDVSSNDTAVATVSVSDAQVTITPVAAGSTIIEVTASDGRLTATQTISVSVVSSTDTDTEAWIPDDNLRTAVRSALGLQAGDALTQQKMTTLTELTAPSSHIASLTGLEYATNLNVLILYFNSVSDLTPLKGLTALAGLAIGGNSISDITPLKGLTALTSLHLLGNSISDITPIAGLTALEYLWLGANSISDATPVEGLTALTLLDLQFNQISDVSFLEGLTALEHLQLAGNSISDVTPIAGLTALTTLDLRFNQISDASALEGLTALEHLQLLDNPITDLAPLRKLRANNPNIYIDLLIIDILIDLLDAAAPNVPTNPAKTALLPNYPNPFNPETWIPYQLAKSADVTLTIYNVRGVMVRQLALGYKPTGFYYSRTRAAHWDGKNNFGEKVATGLYFCTLRAGDFTATRKMLIRK